MKTRGEAADAQWVAYAGVSQYSRTQAATYQLCRLAWYCRDADSGIIFVVRVSIHTAALGVLYMVSLQVRSPISFRTGLNSTSELLDYPIGSHC